MSPQDFSNQSPLSSTLNNIKPKVTVSDESEVTRTLDYSSLGWRQEGGGGGARTENSRAFYSIHGAAVVPENDPTVIGSRLSMRGAFV